MKQVKTQTKKLSLNKVTVRHLSKAELAMAGGAGVESARESACCSSPTKPELEIG